MNKEIKIIDLLNMIANGKNIKNIKYQNHIYEYYNGDYREEIDGAYDSNWLFANEIIDLSNLNDEVEIIEDKKETYYNKDFMPVEEDNKITPQDVENLGYACNTFRKCFEKGWNKCEEDNNKIEKLKYHNSIPDKEDIKDLKQLIREILKNENVLVDKINEIIIKINIL